MPFLWFLLGAAAGGFAGYQAGRNQAGGQGSDPNAQPLPPALDPRRLPTPPSGGVQYPGQLGVPPQQWPIPGGSYIQGIGYCPPGFVYDLSSKLCVPEITTQGYDTGACCGSCAVGGPCEGCD